MKWLARCHGGTPFSKTQVEWALAGADIKVGSIPVEALPTQKK